MSHVDFNKLTKRYWVWPIAWDLFLGAFGGGILVLTAVLDMVYRGGIASLSPVALPQVGSAFALAVLLAVIALALASGLLVFELGQPQLFLRTFISKTSVIKYGALMILLSIVFGLVYFLFCLPPQWGLFYYNWAWLRDTCCFLMLLSGLGVILYTGILLSSMKSKPFWNSPVLPVLFICSAMAMGSSLMNALVGAWPGSANTLVASADIQAYLSARLQGTAVIALSATLVTLLIYVVLQYAAGNTTSRQTALKWLRGPYALAFWGGVVGLGLIVPLLLYLAVPSAFATYASPVLVILASLLLRFLVVNSSSRRAIPGEERYWSRMPDPHAEFLRQDREG